MGSFSLLDCVVALVEAVSGLLPTSWAGLQECDILEALAKDFPWTLLFLLTLGGWLLEAVLLAADFISPHISKHSLGCACKCSPAYFANLHHSSSLAQDIYSIDL